MEGLFMNLAQAVGEIDEITEVQKRYNNNDIEFYIDLKIRYTFNNVVNERDFQNIYSSWNEAYAAYLDYKSSNYLTVWINSNRIEEVYINESETEKSFYFGISAIGLIMIAYRLWVLKK